MYANPANKIGRSIKEVVLAVVIPDERADPQPGLQKQKDQDSDGRTK
jgi:hypothetical protein